ncbi:dehydrogenase/reductase SDR family member 7 isoform X2 [Cylas formicarius]|uniref:dehydrogenase/reductase SDR family member 7 isoform X2 n=1 Tax=Cylas formicarius TaxID=197179 RepID=UPI00295872B1|nr:dehydrogenase/reductase SDR family member 7 isoform X2 [Cylas formicarius]
MFFSIVGIGVFIYGCFYGLSTALLDCDVLLGFCEKLGKSPRRLKGKVAFITGASSGIGEHTAYALAKCGVKLILAARRNHELQRVKVNCIHVSKGLLEDKDVLVIPMDLLDFASHKMHFQHALRHFGTVDILINNAGRSQRAMWDEIELSVDRQMFELNLFSVINLSRIALEYFNKKGEGHIAAISSLAGIIGVPFSASYTGSKHALHGYYNALRTEKLGKNIHVTLICPGPIYTNFLSEAFTGKDGEKYDQPAKASDRRMTAERCGQLNAVAIVNKLSETWIGLFPVVPLTYIAVYFPLVFKLGLKVLGPGFLFKLRDSKDLKEIKKKD